MSRLQERKRGNLKPKAGPCESRTERCLYEVVDQFPNQSYIRKQRTG
jgi:hypothetical protein